MGTLTYENQGLVYALAPDDVIDSMSLGMLTNNRIPGLAQAFYSQMDMDRFIRFNVSSKITVRQFFEGQVSKRRLIGVFKGIISAVISAEEYMIDPDSILLDFDYIFADVSTCETVLICLPVIDIERKPIDFISFFKMVMFSTQFDQTENCDHVARIINYLNSAAVFSLAGFRELLDTIEAEGANAASGAAPKQPIRQPIQQPMQQPVKQPVQQPIQQPIQQPVQQPMQQAGTAADAAARTAAAEGPAR